MSNLEKDAESLIESFRTDLKKAVEEVLSKVYVDYLPHIESDAWMNFRNTVRREIQGDMISEVLDKEYGKYSFGWYTRQKIFEEHKDELIALINLDHVAEIERLKEDLRKAYTRYG